jgi:D-alanine transaminase
MPRIVYVNGRYLPWRDAAVHAEDRGFQFADAVYEVLEVRDGALIDERLHLDRLERSLGALRLPSPMSRRALGRVLRETVRRNRVANGSLYLQVSRGARPRDFLFPGEEVAPTLVVIARLGSRAMMEQRAAEGIAVITQADTRWARSDIKTVMLLPSSLAKEAAKAQGAREAWLVDKDGLVTEGASSNAWIVTREGVVVTRAPYEGILRGVTRTTLVEVIRREGLRLEERPFTVAEALAAREAFITSAGNIVMPVVRIDGNSIGNGAPGSIATRLRAVFHEVAERASQ